MNDGVTASCQDYERIAALTAAMLAAARRGEWDELLQLEAECKAVFAALVAAPATAALPPAVARRKAELIQQVLADDAEIRHLVEPWMAELGQWLGSARSSHRLHDAYTGC